MTANNLKRSHPGVEPGMQLCPALAGSGPEVCNRPSCVNRSAMGSHYIGGSGGSTETGKIESKATFAAAK